MLKEKLEKKQSKFSARISLLNPEREDLMSAMAPVLDLAASKLAASIRDTFQRMAAFRATLPPRGRQRLHLLAHNSIPFGSAILLDHETSGGRIQIETKAYKAPIRESFAFEVVPSGSGNFYRVLVRGYLDLLKDADITDQ